MKIIANRYLLLLEWFKLLKFSSKVSLLPTDVGQMIWNQCEKNDPVHSQQWQWQTRKWVYSCIAHHDSLQQSKSQGSATTLTGVKITAAEGQLSTKLILEFSSSYCDIFNNTVIWKINIKLTWQKLHGNNYRSSLFFSFFCHKYKTNYCRILNIFRGNITFFIKHYLLTCVIMFTKAYCKSY